MTETSAQMSTQNDTLALPTQTVKAIRHLFAAHIRMNKCLVSYAQQLYDAGVEDSEQAQTMRKTARETFASDWLQKSEAIQQAEHECVEVAAEVMVKDWPTFPEVLENVAQVVQPSQESSN